MHRHRLCELKTETSYTSRNALQHFSLIFLPNVQVQILHGEQNEQNELHASQDEYPKSARSEAKVTTRRNIPGCIMLHVREKRSRDLRFGREESLISCLVRVPREDAFTKQKARRGVYRSSSHGARDEKAPAGLHYHPLALACLSQEDPPCVSRTRTSIQPYTCIRCALRAISMGMRPAGPGLHPKDNPRCLVPCLHPVFPRALPLPVFPPLTPLSCASVVQHSHPLRQRG